MNNFKKWLSIFLLTVFLCSKTIHATHLTENNDIYTYTTMLVLEQDGDISPYNDDRFDV